MHDGEGRLAAEAVLFGRHTAECAEWFPGLVPASASLENSLRTKCAVALTGRRIKCGRPVLRRGQLESRGQERSRVRLLGLLEDALRRPLLDHTAVAHATRPSLPTSARPRGRDLRSTRMHNPDGVGLIRPIHSEVIAHSVSSFGHPPERPCSRNGEVGLIPALRRGHFLLNLRRRSLADRDTLPLSLRRLGVERSSGRQAPPSRGAALDLFYSLLFPCL
jgi:hypothetical protein